MAVVFKLSMLNYCFYYCFFFLLFPFLLKGDNVKKEELFQKTCDYGYESCEVANYRDSLQSEGDSSISDYMKFLDQAFEEENLAEIVRLLGLDQAANLSVSDINRYAIKAADLLSREQELQRDSCELQRRASLRYGAGRGLLLFLGANGFYIPNPAVTFSYFLSTSSDKLGAISLEASRGDCSDNNYKISQLANIVTLLNHFKAPSLDY